MLRGYLKSSQSVVMFWLQSIKKAPQKTTLKYCFSSQTPKSISTKAQTVPSDDKKYENEISSRNKSFIEKALEQSEQKASPSQELIRLSKYLSQYRSLCSRRQAEYLISLGLVRVEGKRIYKNILIPISSQMKAFTENGLREKKPETKLWLMNKPTGYICTHQDPKNRKTIYELFPKELKQQYGHLMSIGRLDYNSEGLLLVTNDAELKNLLQRPTQKSSHQSPNDEGHMGSMQFIRRYHVKVHGRVNEKKMALMNSPITIKGVVYGPLRARIIRELSTNVWLQVELKTGKNRQIRRVMQKCDLQVNKLIRIGYGPFKLKQSEIGHKEIEEIAIPPFIDRKLRREKVKKHTGGKEFLIEVDTRAKAIQFAQMEMDKLEQRSSKQSDSGGIGTQSSALGQITGHQGVKEETGEQIKSRSESENQEGQTDRIG